MNKPTPRVRGMVTVQLPAHVLQPERQAPHLVILDSEGKPEWFIAPTRDGEIPLYGETVCPGCGWHVECLGVPAAYCSMCGREVEPEKQVVVNRFRV